MDYPRRFRVYRTHIAGRIAKTAKNGQAVPNGLHGHLVTHVSMNISA
jgi:hypothetical protein